MKNATLLCFLSLVCSSFAQQKETFDLATYTAPIGWKKDNTTANVVGYTTTNNMKSTYCQIGIYSSTESKGSLQADFESEWQALVVKTYKPVQEPERVPSSSENDWEMQGGIAPFEFNGAKSLVMLVTMTGYGRCMSILILMNTEDYKLEIEKFLASVELKKIEMTTLPISDNINTPSILGTWTSAASDQSNYRVNNGVVSTIFRQYTFNKNESYTFITKTFDPLMNKLLLIKENGIYQIHGDNITVIPQKSVIEAWSKKDNTDKWGSFLTTQNRALEKATYQYTNHYFSGIQEWSLVLQGDKETQRDGPFSSNNLFVNAWYYSPVSASHPIIILPGQ
ncbi:hypothetical protein BH09BAC3_BH09BAC3_29440 [soil metagenome]